MDLRRFVNVRSDDDFTLLAACLVAALRPRGPYPILVVNGEQGSSKSVFCRMLRSLVDPSAAPIRAVPMDDRDLIVSAVNSWVLAFDNLSSIPGWLSGALCRLATGGGFATRLLHTDHDEMIFEGQRSVLFNGILLLTDRADLADRTVTINLRALPDHQVAHHKGTTKGIKPQFANGIVSSVSFVSTTNTARSLAGFVSLALALTPGRSRFSASIFDIPLTRVKVYRPPLDSR